MSSRFDRISPIEPCHPELVSGSIGRFAPMAMPQRKLYHCAPILSQSISAKWTLKQVQGDGSVEAVS